MVEGAYESAPYHKLAATKMSFTLAPPPLRGAPSRREPESLPCVKGGGTVGDGRIVTTPQSLCDSSPCTVEPPSHR